MGKGSSRRPSSISREEWAQRYAQTFGPHDYVVHIDSDRHVSNSFMGQMLHGRPVPGVNADDYTVLAGTYVTHSRDGL